MKRTKNAGLTLVELLVSIAVLSIVTLGIGGLLRLAAEQYSNATKETEVQNQAQSVFASVSNSLEDVAIDVTFSSDRLTIVNNDGIIMFEKDGDRLYYDEKTYSSMSVADDADDDTKKAAATSATIGKNQENILADHVTAFSVDTSTKDQGFVVVSLTITIQERSKSMVQNVFMRNLRPKGSAVLLNNATTVPTNNPTTLQNPLTSLTGPAGDGPGGTTNPATQPPTSTPTQEPTSTPTPTPDYPYSPSNTNLHGKVYQGDLTKAKAQTSSEYGGGAVKIELSSTEGNPYDVVLKINGVNNSLSLSQFVGGQGQYKFEELEPTGSGLIRVYYDANWNVAVDPTMKPIINLNGVNASSVSVEIISMDVYKNN